MKLVPVCIVLSATLSVAHAGDWYVDPDLGDDANTGTTQGDPWRTVTHELAPLSTSGEPALGATVDLELWGPAGDSATLFWRRGPVDRSIPTIYGVWYLGRPRTFWAQTATAPWPPATVGHPVPSDPSLVGLSVSFQALSTSGFGTLAFTNPVTLTFVD